MAISHVVFISAVALAAFVAGNPLTWNETGNLAQALLASPAENLDGQAFQVAQGRLQGRDIRGLTAAWLLDYEAKNAALY